MRHRVLRNLPSELSAFAVYAGPPAVAHAEALLRAVESKRPGSRAGWTQSSSGSRTTPHLPREAPNPALVAYLALGHALRLWRDGFPLVEGGTVILLNRSTRRFPHPTQQPYRVLFQALSVGAREPEDMAQAEAASVTDTRAIAAYRDGRACHPLLPFAEWAACQPALGRLGHVLVAGCRATRWQPGASGSCQPMGSARQWTWPVAAPAASPASACCSRPRTSRYAFRSNRTPTRAAMWNAEREV